jgi:hypothetical protein
MTPSERSAFSERALEKQRLRAAVLEVHYRVNEDYPGTRPSGTEIAERLGVELRVVVEAGLYLIDKGFLETGGDRILYEVGNPAARDYRSRITDRGIDFVEGPNEWQGRDVPNALVFIVAGGDVNDIKVSGRDLQ